MPPKFADGTCPCVSLKYARHPPNAPQRQARKICSIRWRWCSRRARAPGWAPLRVARARDAPARACVPCARRARDAGRVLRHASRAPLAPRVTRDASAAGAADAAGVTRDASAGASSARMRASKLANEISLAGASRVTLGAAFRPSLPQASNTARAACARAAPGAFLERMTARNVANARASSSGAEKGACAAPGRPLGLGAPSRLPEPFRGISGLACAMRRLPGARGDVSPHEPRALGAAVPQAEGRASHGETAAFAAVAALACAALAHVERRSDRVQGDAGEQARVGVLGAAPRLDPLIRGASDAASPRFPRELLFAHLNLAFRSLPKALKAKPERVGTQIDHARPVPNCPKT